MEQRSAAERSFRVAVSKDGKAELTRYYAALRRLRDTYRKLDPAIKRWFSLEETVYVAGKTTVIDREIAKVKAFLARPSSAARRDASRNKIAVAWAHLLLTLWRHKAPATRKGKWEQLAQILSGHPNVDLLDHLRAFKRSPGPTLARLRTRAPVVDGNKAANSPG